MSFNLKKLAVAAAVVVGTVGFFAESAEAQFVVPRARFSAPSDLKQDINQEEQQVQASFDILANQSFGNDVENFSLTNSVTDVTFFRSEIDSIGQQTLLNTPGDLDAFLEESGLKSFLINGRDDVFAQNSKWRGTFSRLCTKSY